jgi:hypothetical protein
MPLALGSQNVTRRPRGGRNGGFDLAGKFGGVDQRGRAGIVDHESVTARRSSVLSGTGTIPALIAPQNR